MTGSISSPKYPNEKNITNKNELNQSLRQLRQKVIANIILRDLNQLATFDEVVKNGLGISKAEFTDKVAVYVYKNAVRLGLDK